VRLVHLADLHLGFRQYQRLTPAGINQREADVAATFVRTIDAVIDLKPDVVLLAGDIFHSVRPTNQALLHAFHQFVRLKRELPQAAIIMIAGNHDTPRTAETGGILQLFSRIGLEVVDREARRISLEQFDLSVLAVPDVPLSELPVFDPDPAFTYNVLLMHGEIQGMLPAIYANIDPASLTISADELHASRWSYIALGHYHVYRQVDDNAYYAGSMDYTSLNMWGERGEEQAVGMKGKSFIERDLATGRHVVHPIATSRQLADLRPIPAHGLIPADIDEQIRQTVDAWPGGIDGKIVRLRINDLTAHAARELDHRAIRDYKRRALSFHIDARRPAVIHSSAGGSPGRRPSLADVVREDLTRRVIDADIDRGALVELGLSYLRDAELVPTQTAAGAEE
jgi:DNA repair protein SbcD/Mre11